MSDYSKSTALLIMDVQPGIIERIPDPETYLNDVRRTVAAAHNHDLPVIFAIVGFRPNFPEVSTRNQSFANLKNADGPGLTDPRPALELSGTDIIVTKRRVSAFAGSDLDIILRAQGITHLVLAGIATSGVVLSTLREAADKDFEITVLADLCRDFDQEVHDVLTKKVFPKQSTVTTASAFVGSLDGAANA